MPEIRGQREGDNFFRLIQKTAYFLGERTEQTDQLKNWGRACELVFHYLNDRFGYYIGDNRDEKYVSLLQLHGVNGTSHLSMVLDDLANDIINQCKGM